MKSSELMAISLEAFASAMWKWLLLYSHTNALQIGVTLLEYSSIGLCINIPKGSNDNPYGVISLTQIATIGLIVSSFGLVLCLVMLFALGSIKYF